ncbi:MAG TPA: alpha/beta hydrolase [Acidisoma sp.]|jgi:pimeloyl-ACP methyl ester carboxylesterase|uniref:alpha/beta fold hydrolase n=1 Tax=Acidisoma sp. TaxID=1872115 RepID=UPI002C8D32EC|nr:alpha/beta hydrolase [Acidisoma sp.]HTI03094.1 alpha/beta hydrolase [Acidisoma sp.]
MEPRTGTIRYLLPDGFHDMAFGEWGEAGKPVVVCVHGLTRQGRDFDRLARSLAGDFHVICPDLPGRGRSDWLSDPGLYQPLSYVTALATLLATLPQKVFWVGTSLGGICGLILAAQGKTPIARLVLNDIGPFIPEAALARIRDYMQPPPVFPDLPALEAHLRVIHAPFGVPDDAGWAEMAAASSRPVAGGVTLHYDPAIGEPLRAAEPADVNLWPFWEKIVAPTLTIRGALSDLLLPETLEQMARPGSESLVLPGVGHAPALMDETTIAAIGRFLRGI